MPTLPQQATPFGFNLWDELLCEHRQQHGQIDFDADGLRQHVDPATDVLAHDLAAEFHVIAVPGLGETSEVLSVFRSRIGEAIDEARLGFGFGELVRDFDGDRFGHESDGNERAGGRELPESHASAYDAIRCGLQRSNRNICCDMAS